MNESVSGAAHTQHSERSLASILSEVKTELKEFVNTRARMVRAEIHETIGAMRTAVPWALVAVMFGAVAFLMFTLAFVVLIALAFPENPFAWFYGFLIIGVIWIATAGICAFFAYNAIRRGRFPNRTAEVLKADKIWLQTEVRSMS